jgi:hypothetical protein
MEEMDLLVFQARRVRAIAAKAQMKSEGKEALEKEAC